MEGPPPALFTWVWTTINASQVGFENDHPQVWKSLGITWRRRLAHVVSTVFDLRMIDVHRVWMTLGYKLFDLVSLFEMSKGEVSTDT